MLDWNVVISVQERGYRQAKAVLERYGEVSETEYFNVLVMKVGDIRQFLGDMRKLNEEEPQSLDGISRIVPVTATFFFQSPEEFEIRARGAVVRWVSALAGKTFHVRMHRRGFKARLSSQEEERFLDHFLMKCLEERGFTAEISFEDPDVIIALETIGQRAGLSLWPREERQRYLFLRMD